jgi:hypothetical protein
MRETVAIVLSGMVVLGVAGCAQRAPRSEEPRQKAAEAPTYPPAPAKSKLSKVQVGMTEPQVSAILGVPNDSKAYITGKAFIPYYFGPDQSRFACYYRGEGRVIFAGGNQWGAGRGKVVQVEYDPNEDGNAATK